MYTGMIEGPGVRTNFDMVHLKRIPHQFNHMEGLLNMFKSKIVSSFIYEDLPIFFINQCVTLEPKIKYQPFSPCSVLHDCI